MVGPITLADAKLHLRIDSDEEDETVSRLISTAARHIETTYGVVSVRRDVEMQIDHFDRMVRIPLKPIDQDSVSINYLDPHGDVVAFEDWRLLDRDGWSWLTPKWGHRWPTIACGLGVITISVSAGYGDPDDDEDLPAVPNDIQQAARILIDHWYANRGSGEPASVDFLIDHYRFRRV